MTPAELAMVGLLFVSLVMCTAAGWPAAALAVPGLPPSTNPVTNGVYRLRAAAPGCPGAYYLTAPPCASRSLAPLLGGDGGAPGAQWSPQVIGNLTGQSVLGRAPFALTGWGRAGACTPFLRASPAGQVQVAKAPLWLGWQYTSWILQPAVPGSDRFFIAAQAAQDLADAGRPRHFLGVSGCGAGGGGHAAPSVGLFAWGDWRASKEWIFETVSVPALPAGQGEACAGPGQGSCASGLQCILKTDSTTARVCATPPGKTSVIRVTALDGQPAVIQFKPIPAAQNGALGQPVDVWIGLTGYKVEKPPRPGRRLAALPSGPGTFTARSAPGGSTITISDWGTLQPGDWFSFFFYSENAAGRGAEMHPGAAYGVPTPPEPCKLLGQGCLGHSDCCALQNGTQPYCAPTDTPRTCSLDPGPGAITNVRLTGGPSVREGTLEVETGGQWVAACASLSSPDAHLRTAALACARLGFGARGAVRLGNFYGSAASGSSARDVWCEEGGFPAPDLSYCRVGSSCRPGSQLGVACAGAATLTQVRLAQGPTPREGRVEVQAYNGTEGTVDDPSPFSLGDPARAVCAQLGYSGGWLRGNNFYGPGYPMAPLLESLECPPAGQAGSLNECSWKRAAQYTSGRVFSVACQGSKSIEGLRLNNNGAFGGSEGRLEVKLATYRAEGKWGTACSWYTGWFDEAAGKVACYQLGFARAARVVNGSAYTPDNSLPIVMTHVACAGDEASLDECGFDWNDYPANPTCTHAGDVGLVCTGPWRT